MTANDFKNRIRVGSLYDIYGALLTEKQRTCLRLYFCEDFSLAEIADELDVSRQAIHDLLKRVEQTLEHYETVLGNLRRSQERQKLVRKAGTIIKNVEESGNVADLGKVNGILDELINESR